MIFSELYGVYYNTVAKILALAVRGELTDRDVKEIVAKNAFGESLLTIPTALKSGKWQLLAPDLSTKIEKEPSLPLSEIQKMWLRAISLDPRIALFEVDFSSLSDTEPLFTPDDVSYIDTYADGDDFTDPEYIARFKLIRRAIREKLPLTISAARPSERVKTVHVLPKKLEYSEKDDKFRLLVSSKHDCFVINLGRILSCKLYEGEPFTPKQKKEKLCSVSFEIVDKRNALERVMMHFAHFEKRIERGDGGLYLAKIFYNKQDETEILIRILSFGPFIRVTEPIFFINLIKDRLQEQKNRGSQLFS